MGSALSTFLELYDDAKTTLKWKDVLKLMGLVTTSWYIYKIMLRPFVSPLRKVPGPPFRPIVGNMFDALKQEAMTNTINWMKLYKSRFIRFYFLFGQERLLVADPDIIKYINVTNSKNYVRQTTLNLLDGMANDFVLNLNGSAHHALRKLLNPAFKLKVVEDFVPTYVELSEKLVSLWNQKIMKLGEPTVVEAQTCLAGLTLDIICKCGFGYDMKAIEKPQEAGVYAFKRMLFGSRIRLTNMIPFFSYLPSKEKTQFKEDAQLFKSTIMKVITQQKQLFKDNPQYTNLNGNKNLLATLLLAHDEKDEGITDEVIFANIAGFMFAGFETTSHALTWTLLNLAQHLDCQEKARKEVLGQTPKGQTVTVKKLDQMPYVTCCIKESLRLYPPVTVFWRTPVHDDQINGYFIPKGTPVGISVGALHRLPENWDDPDSFKPERFLEQINPYKFIPFATGPYMCIGNKFSMMESRAILAVLLQNFKFEMVPDYTFRREATPIMHPSPPLILRATRV
ncbi:cytochrome P450 4d1-like [Gigantopelta aegis]|uniref:cytochrome P450 4d1-like n=1 Tax=Gigantopelta aegis TaxID=1735272 RepID=UPI001B88E568|nr:cytochrome P450 4d1-like [Gigantopelta aegis]